ncbi:MAG: hypothetical protein KDC46_07805, partial [Thermoleophilia bacterium]|nr:hypothetical protein [Thermoleophilia bacterium]
MDAHARIAGTDTDLGALVARIDSLERRIAALEGAAAAPSRRSSGGSSGSGAALDLSAARWTTTYEVAQLEPADSWIELHEPSARPHLQRMLRA